MWRGILGKKIGMTQFFTEDGKRVGVTVVQAGPCPVLQVKTAERDGYDAYQLGFDVKKDKASTKAELGHAKKTGNAAHRFVSEIRLRQAQDGIAEGAVITLENWADVAEVQVTSKSKGKGFQGVMKRYNFRGLKATHGAEKVHRSAGSVGTNTEPSRVLRGKKMPGQMGDERVTLPSVEIIDVRPDENLIVVKGQVPGSKNGLVMIRKAG